MKIVRFGSEKEFISQSVNFITEVCKNAHGTIHIALSGGSTPAKIYQALAKKQGIPFEKIEFYQVDERYVPKNHKDSNQKMMSEKLITPLGKRLKAFHYFDTSLPIEKSLQKYQEQLKKLPKKGFDLVILGIGPDGHTASLFPYSKALKTTKLVAHTTTDQFAIKDRLTLTFPAILKSQKILVLLKGKEKVQILKDLQNPQISQNHLPAKALLKHKNAIIHFLVDAVGLEPTTLSV